MYGSEHYYVMDAKTVLGQNFLLVDLLDSFSDIGSGGTKKSSENEQLTGHFQSFFFLNIQNKQ